jgi:phytol kinase
MSWFADRVLAFFVDNFPAWNVIVVGGPAGLAWAWLCLRVAGGLKRHGGLATGYTRKVFHFAIFGSVVIIHWLWGTPAVCLFGGMTTIVIFYAILRGPGHLLYDAMARENDAPRSTHYILVPYFATLIGGLASNILFGSAALTGYLVAGLGDAVGEPVGARFGRRPYAVPSLTAVKAVRTVEGSAAVLLMSLVGIALAILLSPDLHWSRSCFVLVPFLALICTAVEALSPHGWDNATMQVIPAWMAGRLLQ